ncbi:MAG: patatin-like phospholipase family protein [Rubrivivax sp.]
MGAEVRRPWLASGLRAGLGLVVAGLVLAQAAQAAQPAQAEQGAQGSQAAPVAPAGTSWSPARPRVGLVLSGGGARGYAHIGVLRVLEQLRVPVDIVVGTSMGSLVGGAYAAGRTAAELERFAQETDWSAVLADRPPRREGNFRRREADLEVPSRVELGLGPGVNLSGPPAVAGSHALERALEELLPPGLAQRPAGRLALGFRAVATDLRTGELVELSDEPLAVALRASLSVPGLFPPLVRQGRLLVDGGLVRNVPVDLARALGAQVLIVVNVGTPVDHVRELGSALGVAQQMINVLTEQNAQRSLRELGPADVLIEPELGGLDASALSSGAPRAIAAGEAAARALAGRLAPLAVDAPVWAAFEQARTGQRAAPAADGLGGRLLVRPTGRFSAELLAAAAGARLGQPVDGAQARAAADRLYASGDFERVEVQSATLPDGRAVILVPVEAPWRRNPLRLGLELQTEQGSREDATRFSATAMTTFDALNPWGGELRVLLRLGSRTTASGEWWQPLGAGSPLFGVASWRLEADTRDIFEDGQRVTRLGTRSRVWRLGAGLSLGRMGDLQLGLEGSRQTITPFLSGTPLERGMSVGVRQYYGQLRHDTLDSLAFPTQGELLHATWRSRSTGVLAQDWEVEARGLTGFRLGRWGGHLYTDASYGRGGTAPFSLGGFLRLSGMPIDSLSGQTSFLGRVVMGVPVAHMPIGLGGPVRAGFSLEVGGVSPPGQDRRLADLRQAGSAFVSVDTRFGPVYLAVGATHGGGQAIYVFLGPFW